ncbi:gas vesicle protein GvpO [Sphaerisporangium sp. B11E5]|uniref:gas vesicle protein GvpO n=1 Tax=Sphaerisporangium sp. B11E5 TaxID=3153563 RepID=UPI00325E0DEB
MHPSRRTRDEPGGARRPAEDHAGEFEYDDEPSLTATTAGQVARERIAPLVGRPIEGVTMVRPSADGWTVEVEVVEDRRVPSSGDTLAIYVVELDRHGEMAAYTRARTYKRAKGDTSRPGVTGGG